MPTRPFAIAIAGGSGSGKTSLTSAVVRELGGDCAVLDHDSYYRDLAHQPIAVRAATNFDHPDSLDNLLLADHIATLRAGHPVERPCYDFCTHTRTHETRRIAPQSNIVCEGILLLAVPELRRSFDLRVYVDTPADVRALRRVQRDVIERGRTVASVIKQYLDSVRPMHERFVEPARRTADLVLDWRLTPQQQAALVVDRVRALQNGRADDLTISG